MAEASGHVGSDAEAETEGEGEEGREEVRVGLTGKRADMTLPVSNKAKRLSLVALAGGVMTLLFSVGDWIGWGAPPTVVAALTSLVMLLAGFYDWKRSDDSVLFDGEVD